MGTEKLQTRESVRALHRDADPIRQHRSTGPGNQSLLSHGLSRQQDGLTASLGGDHMSASGAFDAVSGQTLTPMSAGAAPASFSGPVQAKKKSKGEKFEDAYQDMELSDQVDAMINMSHVSQYTNMEKSEEDSYFKLASQAGPEFLGELFRQNKELCRTIANNHDTIENNAVLNGADEANMRTKYSPEMARYQSINTLLRNIYMSSEDSEEKMNTYGRFQEDYKKSNFYGDLEKTQNILASDDKKNEWGKQSDYVGGLTHYEELEDNAYKRDKGFAENWKRPRKKGFFARLFGR